MYQIFIKKRKRIAKAYVGLRYGPFPLVTEDLEKSKKLAARVIGVSPEFFNKQFEAGYKFCTSCKTWILKNEFNRSKNRWDKLYPACKTCCRIRRELGPGHNLPNPYKCIAV